MLIKVLDTRSRAVQAAFAAAGIALLVFAAQELLQLWGPGFQVVCETWLYTALEVCAVMLCAAAAIRRSADRAQWVLLTAALALWTIGDGLWTFWLESLQPVPYPSVADVAYVLGYVCFFAGLSTVLVRRLRHRAAALWLDGLVAGFTLAAVGWALVVPTILASPHSTLAATALNTAYVLLDLLLLVAVAVGYALSGWRAGRRLGTLAAAFMILAVADLTYLYGEATASAAFHSIDNVMWPMMMLLVALAAWQAPEKEANRLHTGRETVLVPATFGLISLGVLVRATQVPVDAGAVAFATAAMLVAGARATLTYLENVRMLDRQTSDAVTDALTGLRNRRALIEELTGAVARSLRTGDPLTLCFFDLNGFKHYNDSFGHAAGDELLRRLGSAVAAAVEPHGRAYRLGGDEFCVLLSGRFDADSEPVRLAGRMLSERGEGFAVSAACPNESL